MLPSVSKTLNSGEYLLWTILRSFETLALTQYERNAAVLATAEKKDLVNLLISQVPTDEAFEGTDLAVPIKNLMVSATGADQQHTLIVQGLLLEVLGRTIYRMFQAKEMFSTTTSTLCNTGLAAGKSINREIRRLISEKIGMGEQLFQAFVTVSRPVIINLDTLGERLDKHFNERFGISFADLMGEFVAELIPTCVELGMERRKIVGYLTSVLMGI